MLGFEESIEVERVLARGSRRLKEMVLHLSSGLLKSILIGKS